MTLILTGFSMRWFLPGGYGDDLVGAQLQASVCAGSVTTQHDVHDGEELLDALVLTEVLAALHQERMVPLVVPTDDQTLGTTNGRHHLHLQGGKFIVCPKGKSHLYLLLGH